MKQRAILLLLSLLAVTATPAGATASARAQLKAFAHNLHAISGQFSQTLTDANGHTGDTSTGTLALQAPREFRWQTESPYKQLIVADGSRVWMYDPSLEQVTVRKQSTAEAHSPLTVLTDTSQLDKQFKVTEIGTRNGLEWLRMTPATSNGQFDSAELGFADDTLRRMRFKDRLGNTSDIRFSGWKRNPQLPSSLFNFTPPKGADVIGDTRGIPEVHPLGGN